MEDFQVMTLVALSMLLMFSSFHSIIVTCCYNVNWKIEQSIYYVKSSCHSLLARYYNNNVSFVPQM